MREVKEILYSDEIYPEKLRNIKNPPKKLYAIGNLNLLNKDSLAIVGTRHITNYGIENCKKFAKELTERGIPIVSGMALGTDTVAHKTVLEYGGETIAVLGNGFDKVFPPENIKLFNEIINKNGLVLTEYSKEISARSDRFLERNRIVSGLSEGILVIEAGLVSGTSVTAKLARKQGRVVMALPGRLDSYYGIGVNKLIQAGAKLIMKTEDILINFPQFMNKKRITLLNEQSSLFEVKNEYKEIVKILNKNTMSVDEIFEKSREVDIRKIMELLFEMEIEGIVEQEIGVGYKLKE